MERPGAMRARVLNSDVAVLKIHCPPSTLSKDGPQCCSKVVVLVFAAGPGDFSKGSKEEGF